MAVRLRMVRRGRKKRPFYSVVAADTAKTRAGSYIEKLGTYDPLVEENGLNLDEEREVLARCRCLALGDRGGLDQEGRHRGLIGGHHGSNADARLRAATSRGARLSPSKARPRRYLLAGARG